MKAWYDETTDRMIEPISTKSIYTGTLPFIIIQVVMLGILIAFPGLVTHYKTAPVIMNQSDIDDAINNIGGGGFGLPGSGLSLDGGFGLPGTPNLGEPSEPAGDGALPAPGDLPAPGGATGLPNFN